MKVPSIHLVYILKIVKPLPFIMSTLMEVSI